MSEVSPENAHFHLEADCIPQDIEMIGHLVATAVPVLLPVLKVNLKSFP